MSQRVLVPVDGSERSEAALEYALEEFPDAEITAFHVFEAGGGDLATFASMTGDLPGETELEERADEILEDAERTARDRGATIRTERARGRPDRTIVARADEGDFDQVVIGSHGRDGVTRVLFGSVAEKVVRRAPVPVTVVR